MADAKDPLELLLVDGRALDRARIAGALNGRLAIDPETAQPVVLSGFAELDSKEKVLAMLLVYKAMGLLQLAPGETVTPTEVATQTGMPAGTVRRVLPELASAHQISKSPSGGYLLSNAQVVAAVECVEKGPARESKARNSNSSGEKRRRDGSAAKATRSSGKDAVAKGRSQTKSPGPTALVAELVEAGFFSEPKTLADVQRRLKDKSGHQIPVTSLSPIFTRMLRSLVLDRERNESGVYEYSANGS